MSADAAIMRIIAYTYLKPIPYAWSIALRPSSSGPAFGARGSYRGESESERGRVESRHDDDAVRQDVWVYVYGSTTTRLRRFGSQESSN